ncbi:MAG: hypothetical protein V3U27_21395 [Candidatus Tectomicrobia bacterium]
MAHTPSPWHVEIDGSKPSIRTQSGSIIATMVTADVNPITRAHDDANARLIAAAPDLLAALEHIIHFDVFIDTLAEADGAKAALAQARNAISRAKVSA